MPATTPEIKWQSVKKLGATVVLDGDLYDEAQSYAKKRAEEEGLTCILPFDHTGTSLRSLTRYISPEVKIIGVEPVDANAMALSLHHGERVILDQVRGFAVMV